MSRPPSFLKGDRNQLAWAIGGAFVRGFRTFLVVGAVGVLGSGVVAQSSGSEGGAVVGGLLGLSSGALLGTVGSIVPCSQTFAGVRCIRIAAGAAGTVGLAAGIMLGAGDGDGLSAAAESAGLGFLVGVGLGMAMVPISQRVAPQDVLALGLAGGAVGSAPRGAAIGLVTGTATGVVLWLAVPEVHFPDALAVAAAGAAIGGLVQWIARGVGAVSDERGGPHVSIPVRIRL